MFDKIKTIFILGAGASKQAGAPLMANFLDVATSLHRSGRAGRYQREFDIVFEAIGALQVVHSKARLDIANIESVFAAFEFAKTIGSFCGYSEDRIAGLANAAKALISQTIEETVLFPMSGTDVAAPAPYDDFAKLVYRLKTLSKPAHDVAVITFNYDFAVDFAFRGFKPGLDYGFGPARSHVDGIPLLKLHGSVSWALCSGKPDHPEVVPLSFSDFMKGRMLPFDEKYLRIDFSSRFGEVTHCNKTVAAQPVLVPPTWNKSAYHGTVAAVWSAAARELAAADNVFVIGYSLPETDAFFRFLYALGTVGKRPLERFWVFDPDLSGAVKKRFSTLLGPGAEQRFQYFEFTFDRAIQELEGYLQVPRA